MAEIGKMSGAGISYKTNKNISDLSQVPIAVLILNWNGWADTLECLESVFRLNPAPVRVVVCDNGSSNGSMGKIISWAEGRLNVVTPKGPLRNLSWPPMEKPIPYVTHDRRIAEAGGSREDDRCRLTLIQNRENLGFGGGNNVGLRYLLARGDVNSVWLLNNDTVVPPDTLAHLLETRVGLPNSCIVGATVVKYDDPNVIEIQCGTRFGRWFGNRDRIGQGRRIDDPLDPESVIAAVDYVYGASMLVSIDFLKTVGLMSERYFLYYEEFDWALRAADQYHAGYAPNALVYHKKGRSIGTSHKFQTRSLMADYYSKRNRIRFAATYLPIYVPLFILVNLFAAIYFALHGDLVRSLTVLRATIGLRFQDHPPSRTEVAER